MYKNEIDIPVLTSNTIHALDSICINSLCTTIATRARTSNFGGQKNILAGNMRALNSRAYKVLVAVELCRVNVTVSGREGFDNGVDTGLTADFVDAEAKTGNGKGRVGEIDAILETRRGGFHDGPVPAMSAVNVLRSSPCEQNV